MHSTVYAAVTFVSQALCGVALVKEKQSIVCTECLFDDNGGAGFRQRLPEFIWLLALSQYCTLLLKWDCIISKKYQVTVEISFKKWYN